MLMEVGGGVLAKKKLAGGEGGPGFLMGGGYPPSRFFVPQVFTPEIHRKRCSD